MQELLDGDYFDLSTMSNEERFEFALQLHKKCPVEAFMGDHKTGIMDFHQSPYLVWKVNSFKRYSSFAFNSLFREKRKISKSIVGNDGSTIIELVHQLRNILPSNTRVSITEGNVVVEVKHNGEYKTVDTNAALLIFEAIKN